MQINASTEQCVIVGDGAIGLWFTRLLRAHFHVTLALRTPQSSCADYHFTELNGNTYSATLPTLALHRMDAIRLAILPLKAYQIEPAFQQIHPKLAPDACIVLSHNGLGTIDAILPQLLPTQTLLFMTTTEGALKKTKTRWQHTGKGQSVIAALTAKNHAAHRVITALSAQPNISESTNILPMLWRKLAINCAINPLTAIYQVNNGALAAERFHEKITQVCEEVALVAQQEGIVLPSTDIIRSVYQVINNTQANYSSMNRDINAGRRTEINAINGYICQRAALAKLAVPANQSLVEQIEKLSS